MYVRNHQQHLSNATLEREEQKKNATFMIVSILIMIDSAKILLTISQLVIISGVTDLERSHYFHAEITHLLHRADRFQRL